MIKRPTTPEGYVDLVKQAIFEVEELRASYDFDAEGMGNITEFVDDLEQQVKAVYQAMEQGTYEFEDKDLPFMDIVRNNEGIFLPFRDLLSMINETHRNGLDADG